MNLVNYPDGHYAGFNSAIFEYEPEPGDLVAHLSVVIDDVFYDFSREFINGQNVKFDITGLVRTFFAEKGPEVPDGGIVPDNRLFVSLYTVDEVGAEYFTAINAVVQAGEDPSMSKYLNKLLTVFDSIKVYDGYKRDVSILKSDGVYRMDVAAYEDGSVLLADADDNVITTADGVSIAVDAIHPDVPIIHLCAPLAPFYVRWINTIGGVDYWMFSVRQKLSTSLKDSQMINRYVPNIQDTDRTELDYDITVENKVTVGAGNLTAQEYEALSQLPYSPNIEYFNPKTGKWLSMKASKVDNSMNTGESRQAVEITFDLPRYNTQRS